MVEPHSSNFRVITTNVLGVRIFRKILRHNYDDLLLFFSMTNTIFELDLYAKMQINMQPMVNLKKSRKSSAYIHDMT